MAWRWPHIVPDPSRPGTFAVGSKSRRVWYTVQLDLATGRGNCNCPGNRWRNDCYHVREVRQMTQETALIQYDEDALRPIPVSYPIARLPSPNDVMSMKAIAEMAPAMAGALIPKGMNPGQAFGVMLAGWGLGVDPMTAFRHVVVINGRTEPDAQLMMGVCMANDPTIDFRWIEVSGEQAILELWRKGEKRITAKYTLADADRAHQLDRPTRVKWGPNRGEKISEEEFDGPWQTHTALMLAYNAIKVACKLGAPDLINRVSGAFGPVPENMLGEEPDVTAWDAIPPLASPEQPRRQGANPASRPSFNLNALHTEIGQELAKQRVPGAALSALVGGAQAAHAARWLSEHPEETVASMVALAGKPKANEDGEIIDGEATEAPPTPGDDQWEQGNG